MSELDAEAERFFLAAMGPGASGPAVSITVDGLRLERWVLKFLLGEAAATGKHQSILTTTALRKLFGEATHQQLTGLFNAQREGQTTHQEVQGVWVRKLHETGGLLRIAGATVGVGSVEMLYMMRRTQMAEKSAASYRPSKYRFIREETGVRYDIALDWGPEHHGIEVTSGISRAGPPLFGRAAG